MRSLIGIVIGAGTLLASTPSLAWTVQQVPSVGSASGQVSRFRDPDEALESAGSSLRDSVVDNDIRAQGGAAFTGGWSAGGGYSGQSYGFGPVTASSQSYGDSRFDGLDAAGGYGVGQPLFSAPRHH